MSAMTERQARLYDQVVLFRFDADGTTYTFADRLAAENGWSAGYARRVIGEYRRFAFLAAAAGHPVSPSEAVDQAWHLHLVYTRSYWDEFCRKVLGTPLHHEPGTGGRGEREKFYDWYARTLASYRRLFGEEPPADVWPRPEEKAKAVHRHRRVDLRRNWVVPKPLPRSALALATGSLLAAIVLLAAPFSRAGQGPTPPRPSAPSVASLNPFDLRGPEFLAFYALTVAVAFALAGLVRRGAKSAAGLNHSLPQLDTYHLAYLRGGALHAADVAITRLFARELLRANPDGTVTAQGSLSNLSNPIERAAYDAVVAHPYDRVPVRHVRARTEAALRPVAAGLKAAGLVVSNVTAVRSCTMATLVALGAPAVGAVKVCVGLSRHRPVEFLVFACVFSAILAVWIFARRPHRTRAGDEVLKRLQQQNKELEHGMPQHDLDAITLGAALFGMGAIEGTALGPIYRTLHPPVQTYGGDGGSSSSSCGSSCGGGGSSCGGGGGCGGGCGGCSS